MKPELKECPFCGEEPEMYDGDSYSQIECNACSFRISDSISEKDELIARWNKRVIILR